MPRLACGHLQEAIQDLLDEIIRFRDLMGINPSDTLEQLAMKSGKEDDYRAIKSCCVCHDSLKMILDELTTAAY